jgi:2'-5' RNA ligase
VSWSGHSESVFFGAHLCASEYSGVAAVFAYLKRDHGLPGELFDQSTLHFTICEMGAPKKLRESLISALLKAGDSVRTHAFHATLTRAAGFANGSRGFPNVLLCDESSTVAFQGLNRAVAVSQLHQGLLAPTRYTPHLTMNRSSSQWLFDGSVPPIGIEIDKLLLIRSYHDGKRRHEVLGRWPLLKLAA